MITTDGQPVLIDFGLAREAEGGTMTWTGELVGTPAYMAPEQIEGRRAIDRRTDVYALGLILLECLTMQQAFDAPTREAMFRRILTGEHVSIRGRVPADLAAVVEKAIDRDPGRRYATALAFAEDLDRIRRAEPVLARRADLALRARRWARRQPLASAVIVALTLSLLSSSWVLVRLDRARTLEKFSRRIADAEALSESAPREALRVLLDIHPGHPHDPRLLRALHRVLAADHERAKCTGHTAPIWSARFSGDGERLVSCSDDGTARVWDAHDGKPLHELVHTDEAGRRFPVLDACFAPRAADRGVLTASMDGTVRMWSESGQEVHRFEHPELATVIATTRAATPGRTAMSRVRMSPNGKTVLAMAFDGKAWLWEPARDRVIPLAGHGSDMLWDGGFSPDGRWAATSMASGVQIRPRSTDFTARLWSATDGSPGPVLLHRDVVMRVCFAHREPWVLTASFDGTARLWTTAGEPFQLFGGPSGHDGGVCCANLSPDDRLVVTGGLDCTARLWDTASGVLLDVMHHDGAVLAAEFSPDGQRILTADAHGMAHVWDLAGRRMITLRGHSDLVMDARWSPDGRSVATASWDRTVRTWRAEDASLPRRWGPPTGIRSLATGDSPGALAAGGVDGSVLVWTADADGRQQWQEAGRCSRVLLSRDGTRLVSALEEHRVTFWGRAGALNPIATIDLTEPGQDRAFRDCCLAWLPDERVLITTQYGRALVRDLAGRPAGLDRRIDAAGEIVCAAVDPAGERFAVGSWADDGSGHVEMFDFRGERIGPHLPSHASRVGCLAFSPCGRWLASASDDATARIHDLRDGAPPKELTEHRGKVTWIGYAPGGELLATTSQDGTARLWTPSGDPITAIDVTTGTVLTGAWSADGRELFTATDRGLIFTWKARTEDLVELAQDRITAPAYTPR